MLNVEGQTTKWEDRIENFKELFRSSSMLRSTKKSYQTSKNPLIKEIRNKKDKFDEKYEDFQESLETTQNPMILGLRDASDVMLADTDEAWAMGKLLEKDPSFELNQFISHLRHYMIPVVIKALLNSNMNLLTCVTEGQATHLCSQTIQSRISLGHYYDDRILDIDHLDMNGIKYIDHEPLIEVSFVTQQVHCIKNAKNQIIEGNESNIRQVYYHMKLRREYNNPYFDYMIKELIFEDMMKLGGSFVA